jgi:hypothetical protein
MFRCYSYTIIRERINLCLLKLQLKIHRCVVNMMVWLHILQTSYMQPQHHHFNYTPMYFNGLF